jgi:hypothetical protein
MWSNALSHKDKNIGGDGKDSEGAQGHADIPKNIAHCRQIFCQPIGEARFAKERIVSRRRKSCVVAFRVPEEFVLH